MKKIFCAIALSLLVSFSSLAQGGKIMGYYPYYRTGSVNQIQYDKMTDLIYAFLNADNSGNLRLTGDVFNQPNFNQIVTAARASNPNIRIHISSGGGGLSAWFPAVAGNAANRANFCTQMANFIQTNNLDGWDLDWEFPGTSTGNKNAHEELLKDMKAALDAKGLVMCKKLDVSMAVGGETNLAITNPTHADYYNPGAINYVDYAIIMAYDAPPAYGNAHSTYSFAVEGVNGYNTRLGWPKSKMILALPFYGWNAGRGFAELYSTIASSNPTAAFGSDNFGSTYFYNGCPTLQNKIDFIMSEGGKGVAIWEVAQDRVATPAGSATFSLLSCIFSHMQTNYSIASAPASPCTGPPCLQPNLGANRTTCGTGFPVALNSSTPTATNVTFTWKRLPATILVNASSSANTYNVTLANGAGTYVLIRDSIGCSKSDTILISSALPTPTLGVDVNLCNPASRTLSASNAGTFPGGTSWQWSRAGTDITGATASSLTNVRTAGAFRLTASIAGCSAVLDEITVTSSLPTPVDACIASAGSTTLSITNPGLTAGPYSWFASSLGGGSLGSGTSFNTPVIAASTTYYVQEGGAGVSGSVGGSGAFGTADWSGIITNKKMDFTTSVVGLSISSVAVYVQDWNQVSGLIVTIETSAGVLIGSTSTPVSFDNTASGSPYLITINTSSIPALSTAGSYRIFFSAGTGTPRLSSTGYPFTEGTSSISLTGGSRYFNNLQFVAGSPCARLPVIASVGGSCTTLPVSLLSFSAHPTERGSVLLKWRTANELDFSHFLLQQSFDGQNFSTLSRIPAGNSRGLYSFEDETNADIIQLYYRLVKVDKDNTTYLSSIVSVNQVRTKNSSVQPNPFTTQVIFRFDSSILPQQVFIFKMDGALVYENSAVKSPELTLSGEELPEVGVYLVKIIYEDECIVHKIIRSN